MKYPFELIFNEAQLHKLLDEVNHLKRDINVIEFKPLPCSNNDKMFRVALESGDVESVFFLGVAFALPEKKIPWYKRLLTPFSRTEK